MVDCILNLENMFIVCGKHFSRSLTNTALTNKVFIFLIMLPIADRGQKGTSPLSTLGDL